MVFICANNAVSALNHSMLKFLSPIPATDSVVSGLTRLSIAVSAALFFSTIAPSAAAEVFTVEAGKAGVLFGNDTRSEYDDYQKIKDGDDFLTPQLIFRRQQEKTSVFFKKLSI